MRGQALRGCPLFLEAFRIHYPREDPVSAKGQAREASCLFGIPVCRTDKPDLCESLCGVRANLSEFICLTFVSRF